MRQIESTALGGNLNHMHQAEIGVDGVETRHAFVSTDPRHSFRRNTFACFTHGKGRNHNRGTYFVRIPY